jgi:hypothetical protein
MGKPTDPGKPDSDGITTNMYKNPTGEYIAVVQFLKGRSVAEAYSRVDRHKLSEKELSIFLEGNSAGNKWEKKPGKKAAWIRSDHRAHASYETSGIPPFPDQVVVRLLSLAAFIALQIIGANRMAAATAVIRRGRVLRPIATPGEAFVFV